MKLFSHNNSNSNSNNNNNIYIIIIYFSCSYYCYSCCCCCCCCSLYNKHLIAGLPMPLTSCFISCYWWLLNCPYLTHTYSNKQPWTCVNRPSHCGFKWAVLTCNTTIAIQQLKLFAALSSLYSCCLESGQTDRIYCSQ